MQTGTSYLGIPLPHPFVAGASPFGYRLDSVKRLEDAGCAAVVLHSLFEEQITREQESRVAGVSVLDEEFKDVYAQFPLNEEYPMRPDDYAEHIRRLKSAVGIPIVASLNGRTRETWLTFASTLEQAGADAIEVNMYEVVTDLAVAGADVEAQLIGLVQEMKRLVRIPVAVKLSPYFSALGNLAHRLDGAGADGLVLFNRFYQPDIDIRSLTVTPLAELSTSEELRLRLRWIAILRGRIKPSIIASGGVGTPADGIKALLAGADAVQIVSALLRHGPAYVATMRRGLEDWLDWHESTLAEMKGTLSLQTNTNPGAFERAQYISHSPQLDVLGAPGMDALDFLSFEADLSSPRIVQAYDELPLWSAMFGLLLLDEVPLAGVSAALDVGCGTGFPLIELAERLGSDADVHGVDPWAAALVRAQDKIAIRKTPNVTLHEASAVSMPFPDGSFDLIVSNLGINNFDDRDRALHECRRVARPNGVLVLTTNLQGHMCEFYTVFGDVLAEDGQAPAQLRLEAHVAHRATLPGVRELLNRGGFAVRREIERSSRMRFATGRALLNHYFIKLGFLDAWRQIVPGRERETFSRLMTRLDALADERGGLDLTIPMAYVEAVAIT